MANEASLRDRLAHPINFTVADGKGIEKGALMVLHDARAASGAGAGAATCFQPCAGIAAREKVSGSGITTLAVFRDGIFDVHASGAVAFGAPVVLAESNDVRAAPSIIVSGAVVINASGAQIIGTSLETAADDETFQIHLRV